MRYLFEKWDDLKEDIRNRHIFIFLDYDGTLAPIAKTPDKAVLPRDTKELLLGLSKKPRCRLAIISGRALQDVKKLIAIEDIIYIGNHGLEIEGKDIKFEAPISLRIKDIIRQIREDLTSNLSAMRGVFVEDKNLTLSVHYRLAHKKVIPKIEKIFEEVTQFYLVRNKIKVTAGKKVLEVQPPIDWDKGKAVLWLIARQQFALGEDRIFPVYIGDDVSDKDAFRVLKNKGLTIFVGGSKESCAQYYLKNPREVIDFLRRISGI